MSARVKRNAVLLGLTAVVGVWAATNSIGKTARREGSGSFLESSDAFKDMNEQKRKEMVEQDRIDTILDRTKLMEEAKRRKPWNMTTAERAELSRIKQNQQ